MTTATRLCIFLAFLPQCGPAADVPLINLMMPDARIVTHVHLKRILDSPVGQLIKSQVQESQPQWQQQWAGLAGLDLTRFVDEILIASPGGAAKNPPVLIAARGALDVSTAASLKSAGTRLTEYEGIPMLESTGQNRAAIAFLHGGIAVMGQPEDVRAAIRRSKSATHPPAALAEKMKQYEGSYDLWVAAAGPFPPLPSKVSSGGMKTDFLEHIEAVQGGIRFSPDLELSAEIVLRTEKDAAGMADGVRWLQGLMAAQPKKSSDFSLELRGRRLLISIRSTEQELRAALEQQRRARMPRPQATRAATTSVVPPPPPNTIRITSSPSDMGTVLLPTGKSQ